MEVKKDRIVVIGEELSNYALEIKNLVKELESNTDYLSTIWQAEGSKSFQKKIQEDYSRTFNSFAECLNSYGECLKEIKNNYQSLEDSHSQNFLGGTS